MLSKNKKRLRGTEVGNRPGNAAAAAAAAMPNKSPKQKLALLVGLAAPADPPPFVRSPRTFDDGAIGLGIVAAMSGGDAVATPPPPPPPPARSEPIPIVSPRPAVARPKGAGWEEEESELSESYTCVISHVGGRKRVYFGDGIDGNSGVFFQSPPLPAAPPPPAADFLSHCYLCGKKLQGLDIFMYGGDKAFCSMECRCQQILSDEQWDKCSSEALKPFESYVSPCSAPLLFAAGVAAA